MKFVASMAALGVSFSALATPYRFADPFWGTAPAAPLKSEGMARGWSWEKAQIGNTHPGAVRPLGWVSVCAYSGAYSSGYGRHNCSSDGPTPELYDRKVAWGFSHFHNSGTGWIGSFYNYFLFKPFAPGCDATRISDLVDERAEPGYYAATLKDYKTSFELTAASQAACHRYRFPGGKGIIRIDTTACGITRTIGVRNYNEKITWGSVAKDSPNAWHGYNFVKGVNLRFDLRIKGNVVSAKNDAGVIELVVDGEEAESAIGFSLISSAEAKSRVEDAVKKGFDAVRNEAKEEWTAQLDRIRAKFATEDQAKAFYGALYQSLVKPCDYGGGFVDFTTLWDTYRTEMPLLMSFSPKARDMALFMLGMIEENGRFPVQYSMTDKLTSNSGQAAALSAYVLCDAFFRGALTAEDYPRLKKALESEIASVQFENRSSSFVLDYVGACNAAAEVAMCCGDGSFASKMKEKALRWKDVYDEKTGLLSAKGKFYEGNNWNYSFRPHPYMRDRVALAGGAERFNALLDKFFCVGYEPDPNEPVQPDRRKGIADYMPEFTRERPLRPGHFEGLCNETDMDTPYAYLWCGRSDRLAEVLDLVRRCRFTGGEGGCPGNNDAGSLSSWYVWSCLGLYPLAGTSSYLLGSPSVESAELRFSQGLLNIKVERKSPNAIYPVGYRLNGRTFECPCLPVAEVEKGGELVFVLDGKPKSVRSPIPECF